MATNQEIKYFNDNARYIKRAREKALSKENELCRSDISIILGPNRGEIKMPVPNHMHCGVCRAPYEDYQKHIDSKEHISQITVLQNQYDMIDAELKDLEKKSVGKLWKTTPARVKKESI